VQLDDVGRRESGRSELRDVSLGITVLTVEVKVHLSSGKVHLEGSAQVVLDGV
jgi:hypothetical protein